MFRNRNAWVHYFFNRLQMPENTMESSSRTIKKVTLRDVAERAGIDKATASRALSGKGSSAPKTRELVLRAAQELGFEPDLYAQRLATGRSNKDVALFANNDLGVSTQLMWALKHGLDERNYDVESHATPQHVSHVVERQIALVNKVRRQRPAAIITRSVFFPEALDELRQYVDEGGVLVSYGSPISLPCDQVLFDESKRALLATRHLLQLGHRDIGFCFHNCVVDLGDAFYKGFSCALEEYGIPVREKWLFGGGEYEIGGARFAAAYLEWNEKPTALCIVNDDSASAFVNILAQNEVRVPEDVSVVGFDDTPAARYAFVPLTSVSYPGKEIASHIVDMTVSRLQGFQGAPRQVEVYSQLAQRQSCAPPPTIQDSKKVKLTAGAQQ
jgi:DNA-binding LacI/PurR family transcriptional regulator